MAQIPNRGEYETTLREIGRIATTWAKFEHWIDQAIWLLAGVDPRKGACVTTQINSIHGKFRALIGLMVEANRSEGAIKVANQIASEAGDVVQIRNRFAHGPLDMGINFEKRALEVYMRRVGLKGRELEFKTSPLTKEDLDRAQKRVSDLYRRLFENWALIVGTSTTDELAPPHES